MVECPYCGKQIADPEECPDESTTYEHGCPRCEKRFVFSVAYTKHFYPERAPCLNGEPHDYRPVKGIPEEYFKDKLRCRWCDDETTTARIEQSKGG